MQSVTTLNLNLQYPNYATTMHAVQNDKLSRKVVAMLFDGSTPFVPDEGAVGMVRFHKPDNTNGFYDVDENGDDAVTWVGNVATISLAEQALTCAGIVLCQAQFYTTEGQRLTTFTWRIDVQECAISDEEFMSTDYYSVLSAQISAAISITYRPPYIDTTTGHWMTWSVVTNQYEDSGYSAQGTQGEPGLGISSVAKASGTGAPGTTDVYNVILEDDTVAGSFDVYQGANGQAGASVTGLTKVSGTGAGGTVDTYRLDLSNGQSGGTFDVYNGNDGTGSPGSATPLMDGTAAVGTATAYAREDHRHPTDSTKVDKESGKGLSANDFTNALKTKLEGIETGADKTPDPYPYAPAMDSPTASAGTIQMWSRGDHVHPTDTTRQKKNLYFSNVEVGANRFASDTTYQGYAYKGTVALTGVTASCYADVVFAPSEAISGDYAPICETYNGGVYIWSKVDTAITIPTIVVML